MNVLKTHLNFKIMPYVVINKKSNEVSLYGSLPVLAKSLNLNLNQLQTKFGRTKAREHTTEHYRLVRVELERSERK